MADIAKVAGVSAITVSRALANSPLVTEATRNRIKELAKRHGYAFNVSARNLRARNSRTVAVIIEMSPSLERPMSGPYPLELLGGISQELASAGYCVVLSTLESRELPTVRAADAAILLGQGAHLDAVSAIGEWNLPLVVWGEPSGDRSHVTVGSDNRHGGSLAAERFLAIGRRRVAFIGDIAHAEVSARLQGFSATLAAKGLDVVVEKPHAFTVSAGAEATTRLLAKHPRIDAVFAASDLLAIGAVRALVEQGYRVPAEVSVIGYDDTPLGATYIPALTSVHQNLYEGGVLLAQKALAMIAGRNARSHVLTTRLALRDT